VVREREAEYRLRHKDGGFRWMHDQARPFKDLAGRFMGYVGACRDVTALKQEQLGLADQLLATRRTLEAALTTLSMAAEYPFPFMAGHQRRVAELAVAIARRMKLADDDVEGLRIAAVLHDIGRLTVPAEVLGSSGSLAGGELESVRRHVQSGYELLSGIHFERPVADYVAQHHERLDGSGYPRGLVKDQICLEARIIAVADVVEAMCSQRPHRPALGTLTALQEVQVHAGQLYDADVVRACADAIDAGFHFEGLPARPA
jgi:putative nucleotidyltransferase with HDIG domain